jgi:endonuclease/exonuclease/phosphatase family metal-dependent hydrolase
VLQKPTADIRRDAGTVVDVVIAGDFNRHDQLWGGDDVSLGRQGEADQIIDLMNEFALNSLLRRGARTKVDRNYATTIDLVLASEELATAPVKCTIHRTEHGSDHRAVDTVFDASVLKHLILSSPLIRTFQNCPVREVLPTLSLIV